MLRIPIRTKWEIAYGYDMNRILNKAIDLGWLENKVQVKKYTEHDRFRYVIEPYEENCGCPGLISPPNNNQTMVTE